MKNWDIFISHASEDKDAFVRPLASKLERAGFHVWYDELTLTVGTSLRRSIEKGLANSRCGIVVLSPNFFAKEWPQRELDCLISLEISEKSRILPVWLDVDKAYVERAAPLLVDKVVALADEGLDAVVEKINAAVHLDRLHTDLEVKEIISQHFNISYHERNFIYAHAAARLESVVGFHSEWAKIEYPSQVMEDEKAFMEFHDSLIQRLRVKYKIPPLVYYEEAIYMKRVWVDPILQGLNSWARGKLTPTESYDLYFLLNEIYDFDYLYILFGIPNYSVSSPQRQLLDRAIVDIGSQKSPDAEFNWEEAYRHVLEKYYSVHKE